MITIICGNPGTGKSLYLSSLQAQTMLSDDYEDYCNSLAEIEELKAGGFSYLEEPPQPHLCYSDYNFAISEDLKSYAVDGFKFMLPNPYVKDTVFAPPYSSFFFDEAQRYWDSRMSRYLREEVYRLFQIHRKNHWNIYMTCQRLGNIDLNIRGIADKFIVCESCEVQEDKYGFVKKITIKTREFTSPDTAEAYMLAREKNENSKLGKEVIVTTTLPITEYYDSYDCKPMFYETHYYKNYDYYTEDGYQMTLESFAEYNNSHLFVAPQGYWKNSDYDKKVLKEINLCG